jgi:uncharacterized protein YdaL
MIEIKYHIQYFGRMKKIVLLTLLLLPALFVTAQTASNDEEIAFFKKTFDLDKDQVSKLEQILSRKETDVRRLEANNSYSDSVFREKRRNIYKGAEKSVRMLLNENQLERWSAYKKEQRKINADKIKELREQGASEEDIKDAQFGIFN